MEGRRIEGNGRAGARTRIKGKCWNPIIRGVQIMCHPFFNFIFHLVIIVNNCVAFLSFNLKNMNVMFYSAKWHATYALTWSKLVFCKMSKDKKLKLPFFYGRPKSQVYKSRGVKSAFKKVEEWIQLLCNLPDIPRINLLTQQYQGSFVFLHRILQLSLVFFWTTNFSYSSLNTITNCFCFLFYFIKSLNY